MSASKWIFGTLGFVLFGPLGAILGATAGAILEEMYHKAEPARATHERATHERATAGDVRISLLVLIACVIKADGRILKSEVNYIKPFLIKAYGEENAVEALQMLKKLLEQDIDPIPAAQQMSQHINYSVRLEMVHLLLKLAHADGEIDSREEDIVRRISIAMGIADRDYQSLAALYHKVQDPDWAYTVLEITPDAGTDDIKKAYRRMAMKYHPDKVAGAGEDIQKAATEKFRSINEAYEHIKKTRGIA